MAEESGEGSLGRKRDGGLKKMENITERLQRMPTPRCHLLREEAISTVLLLVERLSARQTRWPLMWKRWPYREAREGDGSTSVLRKRSS